MPWNYKKYGSREDPIRQSDLNELASSYSCSRRFQFRKDEDAAGVRTQRTSAPWKRVIGTATHEAIREYLTRAPARILAGEIPSMDAVITVLRDELDKAAEGLPIDWRGENSHAEIIEACHMVRGALSGLSERACEVVLCEAPFLVEIDCGAKSTYWAQGTIDLVYRPKYDRNTIALADWKTGAQRPHSIILDHGYQLGLYAHALSHGIFYPGEEQETRINHFPAEMHIAHLRDYVPYQKASSKTVSRQEEADFYGVPVGSKIKTEKGQQRGPAWYRARRTELDVARLKHSIRTLVSTVRFGHFVEHLGDGCDTCAYKSRCLNDGFAPRGEEAKALDRALAGLDFDGIGEEAA